MNTYKYTVMRGKTEVVSLDDIRVARKALEEPGGHMWLRYNDGGVMQYDHSAMLVNENKDLEDLDANNLHIYQNLSRKYAESTDETNGKYLLDKMGALYESHHEILNDVNFNNMEIKAMGIH